MDELNALWMESLRKNGFAFLRIKSRSMEPTIKMEERAKVNLVKPEQVDVGDVVVFTHGCTRITTRMHTEEEFIVHRIVDKFRFLDKLYFVHRGDKAGWLGMSIFGEDQLVGVVENHGCERIMARPPASRRAGMYTEVTPSFVLPLQGGGLRWGEITRFLAIARNKLFIYFFIFKQLTKRLITA